MKDAELFPNEADKSVKIVFTKDDDSKHVIVIDRNVPSRTTFDWLSQFMPIIGALSCTTQIYILIIKMHSINPEKS